MGDPAGTPMVANKAGPPNRKASNTAVPMTPAICKEILTMCRFSAGSEAEATKLVVATVEARKMVKAM